MVKPTNKATTNSSQPLSQSNVVFTTATIMATIAFSFGVMFLLKPESVYEFFEFPAPKAGVDAKIALAFIKLYAVRDLFWGAAAYAAAFFGTRKSFGLTTIAGGLVAFADGFIVREAVATGQWTHWGYAPVMVVLGTILTGIFD